MFRGKVVTQNSPRERDRSSLIESRIRLSRRRIPLTSVLVARDSCRCLVKSDHSVWLFRSSETIVSDSLRRSLGPTDHRCGCFILYERKWPRYFSTPPSIGVVCHHNSCPLPVSSPTIVPRHPTYLPSSSLDAFFSPENTLSRLYPTRYRLFKRERATTKLYRLHLDEPINGASRADATNVCGHFVL